MIKANEIPGFLPDKKDLDGMRIIHGVGRETNLGCGFNECLDELIPKTLILDREKTAKELWISYCSINVESTIHFMSQSQIDIMWIELKKEVKEIFYDQADVLNKSLKGLLVVEEKK